MASCGTGHDMIGDGAMTVDARDDPSSHVALSQVRAAHKLSGTMATPVDRVNKGECVVGSGLGAEEFRAPAGRVRRAIWLAFMLVGKSVASMAMYLMRRVEKRV